MKSKHNVVFVVTLAVVGLCAAIGVATMGPVDPVEAFRSPPPPPSIFQSPLPLPEPQRMGVGRAVYLSVYDIRQDMAEDLDLQSGPIKAAIEAALARSGLNWTALGCAPSMHLFFAMIRGETMIVPGGGPPALPTISPVDVGEIAAQAVLRNDLSGRRFRLVGPEETLPAAGSHGHGETRLGSGLSRSLAAHRELSPSFLCDP